MSADFVQPHPAVIFVGLTEATAVQQLLEMPGKGSLHEKALVCIALNGSVSASELDCRKNMPAFLAAIAWLLDAGFPIACNQRRVPPRWGWSMIEWPHPGAVQGILGNGEKSMPMGPLRRWARQVGA